MSHDTSPNFATIDDDQQIIESIGYDFGVSFGVSRRSFVQALGAGLLIVATAGTVQAQERGPRGSGGGGGFRGNRAPVPLGARLHIGKNGVITVLAGKVEGGQGARAELTQAAAEELRVSPDHVTMLLADTDAVPDDGITAGSGTTPRTVPSIRQACAAARQLLVALAAKRLDVAPDSVTVQNGSATAPGKDAVTYADLAGADSIESFKQAVPHDVTVTAVKDRKVIGQTLPRPNGRDIVNGTHMYPSDVRVPGMLYGKILRPPSYGAKLTSADTSAAAAIDGVRVVQDGSLVGVVAPDSYLARRAIRAIESTAKWEPAPHPASATLFDYLRKNAKETIQNPFEQQQSAAAKVVRATYAVPYVQHAPMEPRAAIAQWQDGKLTVWTSTQNPFGVRRELAGAFHVDESKVRVVVPDFGGGFGGKHTGECAVEAARLAQAAKQPVALHWTRAEEFTWAYFRPASVIDVAASLDGKGMIDTWHFVGINYGQPGIKTPYRIPADRDHTQFVESAPPLRHGSYRALAATANNFARESVMDELAHLAGRDSLEFRVAHLDDERLRAVLQEAAKAFGWSDRASRKAANTGAGLACATEKGSFVATCADVEVNPADGTVRVKRIAQAFDCGAVMNPDNLRNQNVGAIIQALGPALREAMQFENGRMLNASFWKYQVPRMADVPAIDVRLIDRPDLASAGAGETPLITVAPAIANAIFDACGQRLRSMPLKAEVASAKT